MNNLPFNWKTTEEGHLQCYRNNDLLFIYFPSKEAPFYNLTIGNLKEVWFEESFTNLGTAIIHGQQQVLQQ